MKINKIEFDYVIATLLGKILRKEVETDIESLAIAISKTSGITLEKCKVIIYNDIMNNGIATTIAKSLIQD